MLLRGCVGHCDLLPDEILAMVDPKRYVGSVHALLGKHHFLNQTKSIACVFGMVPEVDIGVDRNRGALLPKLKTALGNYCVKPIRPCSATQTVQAYLGVLAELKLNRYSSTREESGEMMVSVVGLPAFSHGGAGVRAIVLHDQFAWIVFVDFEVWCLSTGID
jgi:hypothetical protein